MKIGINALQVRAAKSGVGQYIEGLIDGLLQCMAEEDRLVVYATPLNAGLFARQDPRLTLRIFGPCARRSIRLIHEWIALPSIIKRDQLDIFHGPSNFLPRSLSCPAVVTIHDASRWVDPSRYTKANLWYSRWMTQHTLRMNPRVITDSNASKADLINYLKIPPENIRVIPAAAHPRFQPLPTKTNPLHLNKPYMLHVGTVEPGKNIETLIQAFLLFQQHHPDYQLVLAGDWGWKAGPVATEIQRNESIHYAGHVEDEVLVSLYNEAEFFVFPALNEGFGLPPLEAMQCGLPVIASNRSSLPEVLGDAPLYVAARDVAAIADAMSRLADDEELRKEMKQKGLAQAAKYSWAETARKTLEVYREVTARRPPDSTSF